jgi:type II secretory pathway component GspD/PulD (secretin)
MILACSAVVGASGSGKGIMLDVRNARLEDVVLLLTQQSGVDIIINSDVANKQVTAQLYDKPLDVILEYVVKNTAGVDFWKTEDGTYIIGGKRPELVVQQLPVEPIATPVQDDARYTRRVRTEIIKLVNSDPRDLLISMGLLSAFDNLNYHFMGFSRDEVVGVLDQDRYQVGIQTPGTRNVKPASGDNLGNSPAMADSGNSRAINDATAGRAAIATDGYGQYGGAGRPTAGPGGVPGGTGNRPAPGSTAGNSGTGTLLPEGLELVQPFALDNSIIVKGTDDSISEFKDLVHMLDIPPKQVSIKAEFIEVSTNDVKRFGIDWSLERLNTTINTNFNPAGNILVGFTSGNLTASLRAELTKGSGNIINSPIISTINNMYAEINIGQQIPYWTTVLVNNGVGGFTQSQQVNSLNVQTYLRVTPRVNGDNTITLLLAPSVQDTGKMYTDPTGNSEIPETRYQSLVTQRRVMNGETIVVGGFIRKNKSVNVTAIPILGDLPVIGPLFRSTSTTSEDRELLIFITPTIIGERSAGSSVGVTTP